MEYVLAVFWNNGSSLRRVKRNGIDDERAFRDIQFFLLIFSFFSFIPSYGFGSLLKRGFARERENESAEI